MGVLFLREGFNQLGAMAGVGHLHPYAASWATGCRASIPAGRKAKFEPQAPT